MNFCNIHAVQRATRYPVWLRDPAQDRQSASWSPTRATDNAMCDLPWRALGLVTPPNALKEPNP